MNREDITQTTSYFNALRDVADAARKVEEIRVRYENALDRLTGERREAERELRMALDRAAGLTGESLPLSERDKVEQRRKEIFRSLERKESSD